ncbi:MAG TPA: hypothetical protein VNZ58_11575, partial [Thermomicrobiales bacterium]|nr:hypothetical protein [Thermomicrobiales bacterium]
MSIVQPAESRTSRHPVAENVVVARAGISPRTRRTGLYILLTVIAVVMAMPFIAMIMMSFRPESVTGLREIFLSDKFTLENYRMNL